MDTKLDEPLKRFLLFGWMFFVCQANPTSRITFTYFSGICGVLLPTHLLPLSIHSNISYWHNSMYIICINDKWWLTLYIPPVCYFHLRPTHRAQHRGQTPIPSPKKTRDFKAAWCRSLGHMTREKAGKLNAVIFFEWQVHHLFYSRYHGTLKRSYF